MEQEYNRPKRNSNRGKTTLNTDIKDRLESYIDRTWSLAERSPKEVHHADYIRQNLL